MDLRVAFEDEHLLVVDKPAGVVVHPGTGHREGGTLVHGLLALDAAGGDDGPSRDRAPARSRHVRAARRRPLRRGTREARRADPASRGRAALPGARQGRPRSRTGGSRRRSAATARTGRATRSTRPTPRGAVTHFEIVEALAAHTLLEVTLETGRTHQIRVHLEAIDLPIAGDPVYGVAGDLGLERQFLHAARLAFDASVHGRADRDGVAAPGRPRRRARAGPSPVTPSLVTVCYSAFATLRRVQFLLPGVDAERVGVPRSERGSARDRAGSTAQTNHVKGAMPVSAQPGSAQSGPVVSMRELLEAGVHFGHQTRRWNPKMKRFIFTERGGIYIIDLPADLRAAPGGLRLRPQHREPRRQHPLRRHEEAGAGLGRPRRPRASACRT